ncbi:class I SAM-dependent methyltransferase [Salinicoccus sp. HZC-1]|uniref:class I SAM-dependent methyltransferase n=1 Tax=Salinicoccus sp. HZC-1 TaxID=3385497 RepID=UPI00398B4C05
MKNNYDDKKIFDKYIVLRENPLSYNEVVEMPEMKRSLPYLTGKSVLDIGCGMGHLMEHMLKQTLQHITGVDHSARMIDYCRSKESLKEAEFRQGNFMDIDIIQKFDVIVSSLVFHYFQDFDALCRKLSNIMNEDGTLLFSMEHPIVTASKTPETKIKDAKLKIDHYFDESERSMYWGSLNARVDKYHHTLSTIFNGLIQNGFTVENVTELGQTKEVFESYSKEKIEKLSHYPPFIMIKCKKAGF